MAKTKLYLIPTYLSESNDKAFLTGMVLDVISSCSFFLVENVRTARRFISSLNMGVDISTLRFEVLDKHTSQEKIALLLSALNEPVGVISEAGLPGLADPGQIAVAYAHYQGIQVIPLPGASSIQTAVIASGFSGQQFTFHGYLPIQKTERVKAIKKMETDMLRSGYTQVFMETPFRNNSLFEDLINALQGQTILHISRDLFGHDELVKTMSVLEWKNRKPELHKVPAVFCIGQIS